MQLNNLVIFDGEVMAGTLEMGHLHEMAADERHANVDVEVLWRELSRRALQVEPVHDARKLLTYVVGRLERPVVDEVVVAPLRVFLVLLKGVVDVEHGEMVPVDVGEPHFGLIGSLLGFGRSNEDLRYCTKQMVFNILFQTFVPLVIKTQFVNSLQLNASKSNFHRNTFDFTAVLLA